MNDDEFRSLVLDRTGKIEGKVDDLTAQSSRRHEEVMATMADHGAQLVLHDHKLGAQERQLERLDDFSEQTGQHELTRTREKLKKFEEGKRYWGRWVVGTIAALVLSALGALVGYMSR